MSRNNKEKKPLLSWHSGTHAARPLHRLVSSRFSPTATPTNQPFPAQWQPCSAVCWLSKRDLSSSFAERCTPPRLSFPSHHHPSLPLVTTHWQTMLRRAISSLPGHVASSQRRGYLTLILQNGTQKVQYNLAVAWKSAAASPSNIVRVLPPQGGKADAARVTLNSVEGETVIASADLMPAATFHSKSSCGRGREKSLVDIFVWPNQSRACATIMRRNGLLLILSNIVNLIQYHLLCHVGACQSLRICFNVDCYNLTTKVCQLVDDAYAPMPVIQQKSSWFNAYSSCS
uniref:Similar to 65 kD protein kinase n=1 Tax=Arundo donax TaxID=35708 RepID=A0A0A9DQK5_ARUDO